MTGRGRKRVGRPIIDVAICLQIMYDITDEELDEWGTTSERAKRNVGRDHRMAQSPSRQ